MVSAARSSGHTETPLDVNLFCVFGAIGGVLGMYDAVVSLSLSPSDGIATLPIVLVQFAVVVGLWDRKSWGWILGMRLYGASVPLGFVTLWHLELWAWILGMGLYGLRNPLGFENLRGIKLVVGLVAVVYLASRYRLYR